MTLILWLLALAIAVQFATAVLAFRLSLLHGWRWAWAFFTLAIVIMAIRRCLTFHRALTGELLDPFEMSDEGSWTHLGAALASLLASMFMLAGVALIEPLFRMLSRANEVLRSQNESLAVAKSTADVEFQAAREIQQNLFPINAPAIPGYDIAGLSTPATATGGDYFDFVPMPNGCLAVVIGDVSGHGVGPALIMAQLHAYLRAIVETVGDPGEILKSMNRFLLQHELSAHFVTLFLGQLDASQHVLRFASAGHPAFMLRASGERQKTDISSFPLGVAKHAEISTAEPIHIEPNDLFISVTDGVVEAMEPTGELFGIERAIGIIEANRTRSAAEIIEALDCAIREFAKTGVQRDDITAIVVKRTISIQTE